MTQNEMLYRDLVGSRDFTNTYDKFVQTYSSDSEQQWLYRYMYNRNMFDGTYEDFSSKYFYDGWLSDAQKKGDPFTDYYSNTSDGMVQFSQQLPDDLDTSYKAPEPEAGLTDFTGQPVDKEKARELAEKASDKLGAFTLSFGIGERWTDEEIDLAINSKSLGEYEYKRRKAAGEALPGDALWASGKLWSGFNDAYYKNPFEAAYNYSYYTQNRDVRLEVEKYAAENNKLRDYTRYDFRGDKTIPQLMANIEQLSKDLIPEIVAELRQDESFVAGLERIDNTNYSDRVDSSFGIEGALVKAVGEEAYKDNQKDRYIKKEIEDRFTVLAKPRIRDYVMSQLTPEQKADEYFMKMLSDKIYFEAGVGTDLDNDNEYNEQPFLADMVTSFDNSVVSLVDGLGYAVASMNWTLDDEYFDNMVADMNEQQQLSQMTMSQFEMGIVQSYGNGDIWNGSKQLLTGLSGAVPSVALSMTGWGGAIGLGVSGGFRSYADIRDDEEFVNDWGKYGYAVANGVGDVLFARLNHGIFKGAQQAAAKSYASAQLKNTVQGQQRRITKEILKGYGYRKGVAFTSEFLEEAAVELTSKYFEAVGKDQDFDWAEAMNSTLDAGLIGGFMGAGVDSAGNYSGRIKAAANARANAESKTKSDLEKQRQKLMDELKGYATGDPRTNDIKAEIARINSDIESIVQGRADFYRMMSVRHGADFDAMRELDYEIERLAAKAKEENTSAEEKSVIEERLKGMVAKRLELQSKYANESLELTQDEVDELYKRGVKDGMESLDFEIDGARTALEILEDRMGTQDPPSTESVDIARKSLEEAVQKKRDAMRLLGEVDQARKNLSDAKDAASTEGANIDEFNDSLDALTDLESQLRDVLSMPEKILRGPTMFVGDLLDIEAQVRNRRTPEWVEANIIALENSGLTKDEITEIFNSENYAMVTAENPNAQATGDRSNAANNKRAEDYLKKKGYKYHRIVGKYGNGEYSFLVEGMTREDAAEFARQFDQESVAHKDGLVLRDGSMQVFEEGVGFDDGYTDNFSAIKDSNGNTIRFAKSLSDKFVDADGNEITQEDFDNRVTDLATNMDKIYDDIVNEAAKRRDSQKKSTDQADTETAPGDETKATSEDKAGLPEGAVEVRPDRGVRRGDAGILTVKEARDVNNLYDLLRDVYGDAVRMVVMPAGSGQYMGDGNGGLYFESKDGVQTIYVNPAQVRANAKAESEEAARLGVKYRTKSFSETVVEEIGHSLVGSSFQGLDAPQQRALYNRAMSIAKRAKDNGALLNRLVAKEATYREQGKSDAEVMEEVVLDLVSAMSGGQNLPMGLVDSVRKFVNDLFVLAGLSKKMSLRDGSSLFKLASQLEAARKSGKRFTMDSKKEPTEAADPKQSSAVKPLGLKAGADGKVTVAMNESFYKWNDGIKKDIGQTRITKKFNDKFHFINWWKKATDFGVDSHFSGFETEDGRPIDTSVIKRPGKDNMLPSGNVVKDGLERYKDRIESAKDQGVVDSISARTMMNMYYNVKRRYMEGQGKEKMNDETMKQYESYVNKMNEEAASMIKRAAEATNKTFDYEPDSPEGMASAAVKLDITERGMYSSIEEKANNLRKHYGINIDSSNKSLIRTLHSEVAKEAYGIDYKTQSEHELRNKLTKATTGLMTSYYGTSDQRVKMFGTDPVKFFENDKVEAENDVNDIMKALDNEIDSSPKGAFIAYQFIKASTSIGNQSRPNIKLAKQVMLESARWRLSGGDSYIDPRIIQDIRNGSSTAGLNVEGIPGKTSSTIADSLEKLNDSIGKYQNNDGTYNMESFLSDMNLPADIKGRARRFKAQEVLSEKVGAFALNLTGNVEALTIDSHIGRTPLQLLGVYSSVESIFESYRQEFADLVGEKPYPTKRGITDSDLNKHDKMLIRKAGDMAQGMLNSKDIEVRKRGESIHRKINRIGGADPAIPTDFKRRRIIETAMVRTAKKMGLSHAQLSQLMFADGQVMNGGIDTNPLAYKDFASAARDVRASENLDVTQSRSAQLENDIVSAINEVDAKSKESRNNEAMLNQMTDSNVDEMAEAKASSKLKLPFNKVESAEDSPLYRRRSADEALKIKPDLKISSRVVNDALGTDATSRRIASKNSQIAEGQKVGVRLNLNVMKKTGIPVQTMHDKSASGEALKYAAVVTVKNPTLNVNQNARREILTFQENKFPMASVDGEFLTDKISEANFNGVKAFFNPFKHNVFVDAQGRPIKSAEEATVVGNTVYLRGNIEYYDFGDPILREGREETAEQRAKKIKRGPKYDQAVKRFRSYAENILSMEFNSKEDLREAYDNMTLTSQVALNESELASRAEEADTRASSRITLKGFKLRGAVDRTRAEYFESTRQQILKDPENYISRQNIEKSKERLGLMSNQELIDIMTDDALGRLQNRNDDMAVLAIAELINRAQARGDMDAVAGYIKEAGKIGTSAGRILRHFRELKKSTPQGLADIIRKEIESRGRTLAEGQDAELNRLAEQLFDLQREVEELLTQGADGQNVDAEINEKVKQLKKAEREMDAFTNKNIERSWGDIKEMLIQGNLLTLASQVANPAYNLVNSIGRVGVDIVGYPINALLNVFSKNADPARRPSVSAYMYGVKKFGSGFVEALNEVVTGQSSDVTEWRVNRGFAPFRSLVAAITNDGLPVMIDGEEKLINSQRAKLFIQGTLGVPAEIMFRLLSLGDTPFRRAFEGADLYMQGKEMGLKGEALKRFLKYPDQASLEQARREGRKITFQEETAASRAAQGLAEGMAKLLENRLFDSRVVVRALFPYRSTPANMLLETLTYTSPPLAIIRAYSAIANGDNREASAHLGKAVIGGMAAHAAAVLIKEGLLSGPIDWQDDEEKNMRYGIFPPNSINYTGMKRWMSGGDPSRQPDDVFMSYDKLGIIGAIWGATARTNSREDLIRMDSENIPLVTQEIQNAFGLPSFSSMSYMMDQSFLQGIHGLFSVVTESDEEGLERGMEKLFLRHLGAISSIAFPNQMASFYRADLDFMRDTRIDRNLPVEQRIYQGIKNTIQSRTFGYGVEVPIRIDWKGDPVRQTPRGADPTFYHLFDITKSRQGDADPVSNEIYRLYESQFELTKAIGTPAYAKTSSFNVPNPKVNYAKQSGAYFRWMEDKEFMGQRIRLNPTQVNRLLQVGGQAKYKALEELINSQKYLSKPDDGKLELMNEVADQYNKSTVLDRSDYYNYVYEPHSVELFKIINDIYESERQED